MSGQDNNLREQLEQALEGRVCFMGVGDADRGDDAFGVRLAQSLLEAGVPDVIVAGSSPERRIGIAADMEFDHVVFLDAVALGGEAEPGSAVFLNSEQMAVRCPQVSTHKIPLGLLAKVIESNGVTKAWLLGVQPESMKQGQGLSSAVRKTLGVILELLFRLKTREESLC